MIHKDVSRSDDKTSMTHHLHSDQYSDATFPSQTSFAEAAMDTLSGSRDVLKGQSERISQSFINQIAA